jgi:hypothetical protein
VRQNPEVHPQSPAPQPSRRLIDQRVRNRIIEYLKLASSFEDQLTYQRNVARIGVDVVSETINQWEDWVPADPRTHELSDVYTADEVRAVRDYHVVWDDVADRTPTALRLDAVQELQAWNELRQAAVAALAVFERRGPLPEDREV